LAASRLIGTAWYFLLSSIGLRSDCYTRQLTGEVCAELQRRGARFTNGEIRSYVKTAIIYGFAWETPWGNSARDPAKNLADRWEAAQVRQSWEEAG
jgi:hypothetical protein